MNIRNGRREQLMLPGYHDGLASLSGDEVLFSPNIARPPLGAEQRAATIAGDAVTITAIRYCYDGGVYVAAFRR